MKAKYLRFGHIPYWKLAPALFEVLPWDEEDWKLISSLLGKHGFQVDEFAIRL